MRTHKLSLPEGADFRIVRAKVMQSCSESAFIWRSISISKSTLFPTNMEAEQNPFLKTTHLPAGPKRFSFRNSNAIP